MLMVHHDERKGYIHLLPTGSEEREVLGVGSIPDALLPSCQYWIMIAQICIHIVG